MLPTAQGPGEPPPKTPPAKGCLVGPYAELLWMDEIQFAPKKPWNDDLPIISNQQWFLMVSKWFRISSIHIVVREFLKCWGGGPSRGRSP